MALLAAANGGQVLASKASHELIIDGLPPDVDVEDFGLHRLRDLGRAEHVYGLRHPEAPADLPSPRSLEVVPNNLPVQLTSFVGRKEEIRQVSDLLAESALLTLAGSGGCGKTRLALHAAATVAEDYPDGVWLVELAPLEDPGHVPAAVASALGLSEEQFRDVTEVVVAHLRSKELLLILDNCEHVLPGASALAHTILTRCPSVGILATSRQPLDVPGEIRWRVPSLSLPGLRDPPVIESVTQYEAVQLFIARAVQARPDFAVTNENAPAVAEVCHRLDGIPLAIELAAARVRMMSPQQIAEALADRFRLLSVGSRTLMPRQQTLRASVEWSYALLSEAERVVLRRLSVFAGGFSLDAAEAVCSEADVDGREVLGLLSGLVDKSLVQVDDTEPAARYHLLETVRQYARDRLGEVGEVEAVQVRHRDHYLALAQRAEPYVLGADQDAWLARLDTEHDNIRVALAVSRDRRDADALLRLAGSMFPFWFFRVHFREARGWLETALAVGADGPPALRSKVLWGAAWVAWYLNDVFAVGPSAQESLAAARAADDTQMMGRALSAHGWGVMFIEGPATARPALDESAAIAREVGDVWGLANALLGQGFLYLSYGDPAAARAVVEECVRVANGADDAFHLRGALAFLGWAASWQGKSAESVSLLEEALHQARQARDAFWIPITLFLLSYGRLLAGDVPGAEAAGQESLATSREAENPFSEAFASLFLALARWARGDTASARRLLEQALITYVPIPFARPMFLMALGDLEVFGGDLDAGRAHLEEALE
ncbi:MAG: LuxR family transcriptional regulator, partial [Actinomycetota bacterium]|nr:LuxR family transcriptional regulator [Actinomycetota bacterium]